ncbi:klaroid protein-like [Periplaneta americana]|uniref:klaroid protein-like n=1 Tax=Periplaneta americana TaxID=6978 RepID=UPI0037E753F9
MRTLYNEPYSPKKKEKKKVIYESEDPCFDLDPVGTESDIAFSSSEKNYGWLRVTKVCVITNLLALSVLYLCYEHKLLTTVIHMEMKFNALIKDFEDLSENIMAIQEDHSLKVKEISAMIPRLSQVNNKLVSDIDQEIEKIYEVIEEMVLSNDRVQSLVSSELQKYDADKTGLPDFALEATGGSIVSIRDTKSYNDCSIFSFFSDYCHKTNTPRLIIQPGVLPGECWAFEGSSGSVVIQLTRKTFVTGVSLEHIPASVSIVGHTKSAPKDFSIWGLEHADDEQGFLFGHFTYDNEGNSLQTFFFKERSNKPFLFVELKVHSNHGHKLHTCIYRFRVHGSVGKLLT